MTENNISSASDTITMYCTQPDLVWDIVDKDGVNYVKQVYITKKYQDTAWIFDTAYKFFRQEAVKIIPKPQELNHQSGCTVIKNGQFQMLAAGVCTWKFPKTS